MDEASRWGLKDKKHPLENLAGVLYSVPLYLSHLCILLQNGTLALMSIS
jgi:hypothetical protein